MTTALVQTSADTKSYRILTLTFAALTAIMFALSWDSEPLLFLVTTGTLVACTLALRAAWLCQTKYAPTPSDPWWQSIWVERKLRAWILHELTLSLMLLWVMTTLIPSDMSRRRYLHQFADPPVPGESARSAGLSAPEPECPRVAPYVTKRGEVFWCAYARPFSDSLCATAGEIDLRTCFSQQAPGEFWDKAVWCDRGTVHYATIYRNSQGELIECMCDLRRCARKDSFRGGCWFCMDYSTCQPQQQHPDDKSCYSERK